ncbi:MAG: VOC family protein [Clostridia bacterium]|nr:VOC family protein [Clostridia bacterium]
MRYICPLLVVENMEKSRYFYETLLEQKVVNDYGENITFMGAFSLHLKSHFNQLIHKENKPFTNMSDMFELYFETDDIEKMLSKLKREQLIFLHEINEQPWKQKVFRVYDYDGHIVEIGESVNTTARRLYQEGKSIKEIADTLYLSVENLEKIIFGE